jgi:hypothetical protein
MPFARKEPPGLDGWSSASLASAPVSEHEPLSEEILAADEPPTPMWLPVLGAALFLFGLILLAAQ